MLAWVHLYPPDHCAGAEMMLHEILLGLKARGHDVAVIVDATSESEFEGVSLRALDNRGSLDLINWADIVVTHLDRTQTVMGAVGNRCPIVHLIHNDQQLKYHGVTPKYAQLVVANSEWIRDAIRWPGETIVVPPPVHADRYRVARGDAVTLVNLSEPKGANTFWEVAAAMPDTKFLGVIGGYGKQVVPQKVPKNVTVLPHTPTITDVYAQTKIIMMPSSYESWGRVGIEAAASGIPTIAHPTPGLQESLSASGTFVDREDIDGWIAAIRALQGRAEYERVSKLALQRSEELNPVPHIDALAERMVTIAHDWARRQNNGRTFTLMK